MTSTVEWAAVIRCRSTILPLKRPSAARLRKEKIDSPRGAILEACRNRWKLTAAAHAILCHGLPADISAHELAARAKACPVSFTGPRPIDEAISSAGGVRWDELDDNLMLRELPGVFVAGEMIDWEAPTGGYLMQGCFATGTLAGDAAARP